MVKQPIAKHVLIIEHFRYFLCSLIQLSDFYAIQCANWRLTNVLWASEVKEQHWKHRKKMSDSFLQFFLKTNFRPLSNLSPIASSILVCFEWFKILWVHHLGLYKAALYSRGKDAKILSSKF